MIMIPEPAEFLGGVPQAALGDDAGPRLLCFRGIGGLARHERARLPAHDDKA